MVTYLKWICHLNKNLSRESINILQKVNDIGFIEFTEKDVVRNPLVSKIVTEYEKFERDQGGVKIFN